ncbi:alpha/beta hydrolase family protein [Mycobacteroides chelonae]|jgi:esterase FrsA|uniref:alpha/beta hydrolase n=1 Tax=Mycobacteroides chelonae TaxID=1774 RepID=UPI0008AA5E10|nr:alpha/beta hydrolase [Mycobacteroides chelonae]OHU41224.1 alpha/beta hydrolase [Mycobacteroides chelonae]
MHELSERAELVRLHGRAQGISSREIDRILLSIDSLDDGPHGWATTWARAAEERGARGDQAGAMARLNLARFPFASTPDGHLAHARCVAVAGDIAADQGIARLEFGDSAAWYRPAPDAADTPRLLVVCGGIVSIKEQWFTLFGLGRRLGLAVLLTELPGVGEHDVAYGVDAPERFSALLDSVAGRQPFQSAFAMAMSFGGTVALKAAARDSRIGGLLSVGPPIRHFFQDREWWPRVPQTTKDALAVTTRMSEQALPEALAPLALEDSELAAIDAPVTAVASLRDEILPTADPLLLRAKVPSARVVAYDDVHGSPRHLLDTRLLTFAALTEFSSPRRPLLVGAARFATQLRRSERNLV